MAGVSTSVKRDPRFKRTLRQRAARLYNGGASVEDVAQTLGVSKGRAYILILEGGAKLRRRGPLAIVHLPISTEGGEPHGYRHRTRCTLQARVSERRRPSSTRPASPPAQSRMKWDCARTRISELLDEAEVERRPRGRPRKNTTGS